MPDTLVDVEQLSFAHGQGAHQRWVLTDITLEIRSGELAVLTGPSGSGKSTLLTIIGGLRSANKGSVRVLDRQLIGAKESDLERLRRQVGFIFQQHNLAPALSLAQNIQMGMQHSDGHKSDDAAARIQSIAARVGLDDHLHKPPSQLSGGQQQRAGIARALVQSPKLILADEPTASLDRTSGQMVMDLFREFAAAGSAVILVTHDKRVLDQADRILHLEDGQLVPAVDQLMHDTSEGLKKLMHIDAPRLGRMMSVGQALAQVALADGKVDAEERIAMREALTQRKIFSGAELDLIVDLALAQAQAWLQTSASEEGMQDLQRAVEAVALADDVVTEEERAVIRGLLRKPPA